MRQKKSMKFITNASVVRHILLANVIYGDAIQRKVDQASHMSPLQAIPLLFAKAGFE